FLCPSRRSPDASLAIPGKEDYAFATDDTWWFRELPGTAPGTPHWLVVLYGAAGGNVLPTSTPATLAKVASLDGAANTLLLAGKGMKPSLYTSYSVPGDRAPSDNLSWAYPVAPSQGD